MISFKEFLASQEDRLRAEHLTRIETREKWAEAVASLIGQIEAWIKESDPDGLVKIRHKSAERDGWPQEIPVIERMELALGKQVVQVLPVAMDILGPRWKPAPGRWTGRVDLGGESDHDYELFRFTSEDDTEAWYLRDTKIYQLKLLDQASFDAALVDLFS